MAPVLEQSLDTLKNISHKLSNKKLEFGEFDQYIYQGQDKDFCRGIL